MELESYYKNTDFWMRSVSKKGLDIRDDIEALSELMAIRDMTDSNQEKLWFMAYDLLSMTFQALTRVTDWRFMNARQVGSEEVDYEKVREKLKYFLISRVITDRQTGQPLILGHVHATNALESPDDSYEEVKHAEDYMKTVLEKWLMLSPLDVLYGVIIIGGDIAFYQIDKQTKTFSRIVEGKAVEVESTPTPMGWEALHREEGLVELLDIFMKAWRHIDEDGLRKQVEFYEEQSKRLASDANRQRTVSGGSSSSTSEVADSELSSDRETSPEREEGIEEVRGAGDSSKQTGSLPVLTCPQYRLRDTGRSL